MQTRLKQYKLASGLTTNSVHLGGRGGDGARDGMSLAKGVPRNPRRLGRLHESKTHKGIFDLFNSERRLQINEARMACFFYN